MNSYLESSGITAGVLLLLVSGLILEPHKVVKYLFIANKYQSILCGIIYHTRGVLSLLLLSNISISLSAFYLGACVLFVITPDTIFTMLNSFALTRHGIAACHYLYECTCRSVGLWPSNPPDWLIRRIHYSFYP